VWVAGRQVVDAGVVTTVDEESARAAAQRAADAVSRRVAA
jgi:methylmalonyl-CoA mutase cobalamin-binding subunit